MDENKFDSSTEYKTAYTWKTKPQEGLDKYEEAVERMMQAQFLNIKVESPKKSEEVDPYELIVQRKMNENGPEENADQQQLQKPNSDSASIKSYSSHHSHHSHHSQNSQQYQEYPKNVVSDANSVSSRSSSRSSKSRNSDLGSFQEMNDNLSAASSLGTELKFSNRSKASQGAKKKKKSYKPAYLSKSPRRSMIDEEFSPDLRPIFFRNPDHATEEERKHLYGPFYVSWPKEKAMPPEFAELQKVYHNNHYYV